MPHDERLGLLPFVQHLGAQSRRMLDEGVQYQSFAAGAQIIARGDEVAGAYFVLGGALRVYFVNAAAREGTLYWVDAGQSCILALNCTFARLPYPAWVESDGPSDVAVIPSGIVRELFAREPPIQRFVFETLSARLFELMTLVEEAASQGLEARLAGFLLRRSKDDVTIEITQEQIANHISTSREVVSRLLRSFAKNGLIELGHGHIHLVNPAGLARLTQ